MRFLVLSSFIALLTSCLPAADGSSDRDSGFFPDLDGGALDSGQTRPDSGPPTDSGTFDTDSGSGPMQADAGPDGTFDAGYWCPQRSSFLDFCEASRLGAEWDEFTSLPGLRACSSDEDCAFLPPGPLYRENYDCECSTGGAIWGKDGMALNVAFASRAQELNDIFLTDECRRYEDCIGGVCDGRRRIGAACSFNTCHVVDDLCAQHCGFSDFDGGPNCR